MIRIYLGKGKFAIIDYEDAHRVLQHKWHCSGHADGAYAVSDSERNGIGGPSVYMHRLILDAPADKKVDHINGNRLDNRKENLRLATHAQNQRNRTKSRNNKTGYKGVYRIRNRWQASITVDGKRIRLGAFGTPEDAARSYDAAAREYHGEFAKLNFPIE